MEHNLYIPKKIKVGFQNRQGTFTGKLAYIIYIDDKGVLRKETSWQGWRDQKIEPLEFDNEPRAGFLFNKGVQRYGYHWGSGRSSIRVYDPRDFEFEINVDNLIGILIKCIMIACNQMHGDIFSLQWNKKIISETFSSQIVNILAAINEIPKMNNISDFFSIESWKEDFIQKLLHLVMHNDGVVTDAESVYQL